MKSYMKRAGRDLPRHALAPDARTVCARGKCSATAMKGREYNRFMGFEEIAHTADWAVRVWAQDLPSLFAEAGRAMNALAGTVTVHGPRRKQTFETDGPDLESLLVAFLSELVYYQERDHGLAFDRFDIRLEDQHISANMEGASIVSVDKAIKAVTYHNLKIEEASQGYEVVIVFDV